MANEYLEAELEELQAAIGAGSMPPLRLAHIHRAVRLFQRSAQFRMRTEDRYTGRSAGGNRAATKHEGQTIDRLLQRRRLGLGIGLAEIPQQQRKLVAAEPADHVR